MDRIVAGAIVVVGLVVAAYGVGMVRLILAELENRRFLDRLVAAPGHWADLWGGGAFAVSMTVGGAVIAVISAVNLLR